MRDATKLILCTALNANSVTAAGTTNGAEKDFGASLPDAAMVVLQPCNISTGKTLDVTVEGRSDAGSYTNVLTFAQRTAGQLTTERKTIPTSIQGYRKYRSVSVVAGTAFSGSEHVAHAVMFVAARPAYGAVTQVA